MDELDSTHIRTLLRNAPIAIFFGGIMIYNTLQALNLSTKFNNLPISKLRSASKGLVRLKGVIAKRDPVLANEKNRDDILALMPSVKSDSVVWFSEIQGLMAFFVRGWKDISSYFNYYPVKLSDQTGEVLIDLSKSLRIDKVEGYKFMKTPYNRLPKEVEGLAKVEKLIGKSKNVLPGIRRYSEVSIRDGEEIELIGSLRRELIDGKEYLVLGGENGKEVTIRSADKSMRALEIMKISTILRLVFGSLFVAMGTSYIIGAFLKMPNNYILLLIVIISLMIMGGTYLKFYIFEK